MARFIEVAVKRATDPSVGPGRDHSCLARCCQQLDDPGVGIKCLIGDQQIGLHIRQERSAPIRSRASPPVKWKLIGLPRASTRVWILVLSPPLKRPTAWSSSAFFSTDAMLMSVHDGAVDHRIFVVGIGGEMLEQPPPNARLCPTAEPPVDIFPVTIAFGKVSTRNTGPKALEHRLNEQTIVCRGDTDREERIEVVPFVIHRQFSQIFYRRSSRRW